MALTTLRRAGIVKRSPRTDCIYWYALTELGELVCMYLPDHSEDRDHSEILDHSGSSFDMARHRLGKLCSRGHAFNGTEQSLRYKGNGGCVVCLNEDQLARSQRKGGRPRKALAAVSGA